MILPILAYGYPSLRLNSEIVKDNYDGLDELINSMFETMESANGIGLAASQIGINIRLIVIDADKISSDFPDDDLNGFNEVFINPIIDDEFGDDFSFREACLSLPRISDVINRPSKIKVTYFDRNWNLQKREFSGIKARLIQHEYDYLDGKLWIDRLSPLKRKLIQSKLEKISKGNVYYDYPMKFIK